MSFFLSIGFAILSSNLSVLSNIVIADASWNVHLYRPEVHDTNTEGATYSINNDRSEITFTANLDAPGDYVEYDFYIVNDGTIDAIIDSFTINGLDSNYIEYSLTYYSGASVSEDDLLKAKTSKRLKLYVSYKYNVDSFIDVSNMSGTISFTFIQPMDSELVWNYDYVEEIQKFTAPKSGTYKIETWGAQGGSYYYVNDGGYGGYGGYSTGNVQLNKNDTLFVLVGGAGTAGNKSGSRIRFAGKGGYNGGGDGGLCANYITGNGGYYYSGPGGGGATSLFNSSDVSVFYGSNIVSASALAKDGISTDGTSLVITGGGLHNIYIGGNISRTAGEYYKVEWRGKGLTDPNIVFDTVYYPPGDTTNYYFNGVEIIHKKVTDELVEIYYKILEDSRITEFRLEATNANFVLHSKTIIKLNSPIIVSGAGGGYTPYSFSGAGGGLDGGNTSSADELQAVSYGATQYDGFYLGVGEPGLSKIANWSRGAEGNGGSGAGYFGGTSSQVTGKNCDSSGSGGSGYIGNNLLTNKAMYCYNCTESSDTNTKTISTTNVSETPTSNYAKIGHGYARITYVG